MKTKTKYCDSSKENKTGDGDAIKDIPGLIQYQLIEEKEKLLRRKPQTKACMTSMMMIMMMT